jgi:NAD(P)-dependent dehydrogenase (short-subunit alcohol dehydrogenase family)
MSDSAKKARRIMNWTPDELPSLEGKGFAITGGNSGLGLEAAKILAGKGARVVITARSEAKAQGALDAIRAAVPSADVDFVLLDLTNPTSIESAAVGIREKLPRLDALINNAGVMQPPLVRTDEGYELQMATNHLGHFRLNSKLLDHLEASGGRIVAVSSIAHKFGKIDLNDLMFERRSYDSTVAYGQSKLANLLYAKELDRRLEARGSKVVAIACHPGYAATNLQSAGVGMDGGSRFFRGFYAVTNKIVAQSAEEGAYPLVLAAAEPDAQRGEYYGPTWFMQMRGPVGVSFVAKQGRDEKTAAGLWDATEKLVGPFFAAA